MKVDVKDWANKKAGDIELSKDIFGLEVRGDILQRVVEWQRANARAGTSHTKPISEVSGTSKKPFRQKGTGNARQGSLRSPQMRGGATMHGPRKNSNPATSLPKAIRRLGLKMALSAKQAEGKLIIVSDAKQKQAKTSELARNVKALSINSALVIDGQVDENFRKSASNIPHLDVLPVIGANVYDILRHDTLVLTQDGVKSLQERLAA